MNYQDAISEWHKGFYSIQVYEVRDLSPLVTEVVYFAEVLPHGSGFLKKALVRKATFVEGKMHEDEDA